MGLRNKFIIAGLLVAVILILAAYIRLNAAGNDFTINVDGEEYNIVVGMPAEKGASCPLVIYYHGGRFPKDDASELRNLSMIFTREGFLFWAPEQEVWRQTRGMESLERQKNLSNAILERAVSEGIVNKSDINVVGFDLGGWVAFEQDAKSPYVRTVSLVGFGAPFDNTLLSRYVSRLVNDTDYGKISPKILLVVSKQDDYVDISAAESLREKMAAANKTVECIEYQEGGHMYLSGPRPYAQDVAIYLKGGNISTSNVIDVDEKIVDKWRSIWETGYW